MSERDIDFLKLKKCINEVCQGTITPYQLGKLWKQYVKKYVFAEEPETDYLKIFTGTLDDPKELVHNCDYGTRES